LYGDSLLINNSCSLIIKVSLSIFLALASLGASAISFMDFYQNQENLVILPIKAEDNLSAPVERSSSVTLVYDSKKEIQDNLSRSVEVEVNGSSETELFNQQTLILALKPGKYTLQVTAGRSDSKEKSFSLLPDNHKKWSIPAFEEHINPNPKEVEVILPF